VWNAMLHSDAKARHSVCRNRVEFHLIGDRVI